MTTKVNVYKERQEWCYAAWVDGEFDCSDTLDVSENAGENEALSVAAQEFPGAEINRVDDI